MPESLAVMVDMLFIALLGSLFAKTLGVHRQYVYFCSWIKGAMFFLFGDTNIVIINELSNTLAFFIYIIFALAKLK